MPEEKLTPLTIEWTASTKSGAERCRAAAKEREFLSVIGRGYAVRAAAADPRTAEFVSMADYGRDYVEAVLAAGEPRRPRSADERIMLRRKIAEVLDLVNLGGRAGKRLRQLTEFEVFQVSLARTLMTSPEVLLFNDPFSSVDSKLRADMLFFLRAVQKKLGFTVVYVTDDDWEAFRLSDRILVMNEDRIEQEGAPEDIYYRPETYYVASRIDRSNIFEGYISSLEGTKAVITTECGTIRSTLEGFAYDEMLYIAVRPSCMKLVKEPPEEMILQGRVTDYCFAGGYYEAVVQMINGQTIIAYTADRTFPVGSLVYLDWEEKDEIRIHTVGEPIYAMLERFSEQTGHSLGFFAAQGLHNVT